MMLCICCELTVADNYRIQLAVGVCYPAGARRSVCLECDEPEILTLNSFQWQRWAF